jgi:hypothetical protein
MSSEPNDPHAVPVSDSTLVGCIHAPWLTHCKKDCIYEVCSYKIDADATRPSWMYPVPLKRSVFVHCDSTSQQKEQVIGLIAQAFMYSLDLIGHICRNFCSGTIVSAHAWGRIG